MDGRGPVGEKRGRKGTNYADAAGGALRRQRLRFGCASSRPRQPLGYGPAYERRPDLRPCSPVAIRWAVRAEHGRMTGTWPADARSAASEEEGGRPIEGVL